MVSRYIPHAALAAGLALCAALAATATSLAPQILALTERATLANPWAPGPYLWLLYGMGPAVALAVSVLLMAPGLLAALLLDRRGDFGLWLIRGFGLSAVGLSAGLALVDRIAPALGQGPGLAALLGLIALALIAALAGRTRRGDAVWTPFAGTGPVLLAMLAVPLVTVIILMPKFYWEAFNGDGAQIFLSALWLIDRGTPFWPAEAGYLSEYPGVSTLLEAYAESWHLRLFGATEFGARAGMLTGLAMLTGLVADLIRHGRGAPLRPLPVALIGAAMVCYGWTMAWNASYSPYFSDIASPALREPLVAFVFFAVIKASLAARPWVTGLFMALAYASSPGAPAFIGIWLIADLVAGRPWPWRRFLTGLGLLALVVVAGKLLPHLFDVLGIGPGRDEFDTGGLAARLRFVTPFETVRLLFIAVPTGLVPALALLLLPAQDRIGRAIALAALAYGAFFYFQAYRVLLHHFSPVALAALIPFWRMGWTVRHERLAAGLATLGLAASFSLASPSGFRIYERNRTLGQSLSYEAGPMLPPDPVRLLAFHDLLGKEIPLDFTDDGWRQHLFVSPLAIYAHAEQPRPDGAEIRYRVLARDAAPGPGWVAAGEEGPLALWRREDVPQAVDASGEVSSISPQLFLRRETIFSRGARKGPHPVWDLARLAGLR